MEDDRDSEKSGWRLLATALVSGAIGAVITVGVALWARVERLGEALHLLEVRQATHESRGENEDANLRRRVENLEQGKTGER